MGPLAPPITAELIVAESISLAGILPLPSDGSVLNCQVKSGLNSIGLNSILMVPAGPWMDGWRSGHQHAHGSARVLGQAVRRQRSRSPAADDDIVKRIAGVGGAADCHALPLTV
jgi:hypothetical protein